jgi:molybdopterin synthase sulfur carrier subunit
MAGGAVWGFVRVRRISAMGVVCVRGALRKLVGGRGEHELEGATVVGLLRALEERYPDVAGWIVDERGLVRRHINVFVNGERAEGATAVRSGDRVDVLPAITGGEEIDRVGGRDEEGAVLARRRGGFGL